MRQTFLDKGAEIAPLHPAGILKFVNHVVIDARAGLLVDKRGVAVRDDLVQQFRSVGDEHDVLFLAVFGDAAGNIGQDAQRIIIPRDFLGGMVISQVGEAVDDAFDAIVQSVLENLGNRRAFFCRHRLGEAAIHVICQGDEGGRGFFRIAVLPFGKTGDWGVLSAFEVRSLEAVRLEEVAGALAPVADFLFRPANDLIEGLFVILQRRLVFDISGQQVGESLVTFLENFAGKGHNVLPQVP